METQELPKYWQEYNEFISNYGRGETSGEEVGELIARLAQYFAEYNMHTVKAERRLALVARDIESRVDESTGKLISSTKAKVMVDGTDEADIYNTMKAHRQNIEQFLNSLKSLQKGILNEYQFQG